jgi:hypothetical protein
MLFVASGTSEKLQVHSGSFRYIREASGTSGKLQVHQGTEPVFRKLSITRPGTI